MKLLKRKNLWYLGNSFRKSGKVIYREKYIGKEVPQNIENIKDNFLRKCMQEELFVKLDEIKEEFKKEWKHYPESIKKKIIIDMSIKFTYNSNAIENSTITLDETEEIIKRKISVHKPLDDIEETIKHSKVFFEIINETEKLSLNKILEWHKELFLTTKQDIAGKLREYRIKVGDYVAPDWQDIKDLMKQFIEWYNENMNIMHPVELAARAHYKFEKIHPFGDGNGRIGRLLIAYSLSQNKYPILFIEYNNRKSYYKALSKTENDFLHYFMRRYLKAYKKYIHQSKSL